MLVIKIAISELFFKICPVLQMIKAFQIREAIENWEANVEILATLPDKELVVKLDLVHIQTTLAEEKNNTAAIELLEIWRSQIIAARIYKAENNIADAPNDLKQSIASIESIILKAAHFNPDLSAFSYLEKNGFENQYVI